MNAYTAATQTTQVARVVEHLQTRLAAKRLKRRVEPLGGNVEFVLLRDRLGAHQQKGQAKPGHLVCPQTS
ncbi:hypothetical protein I5E19_29545 [Pseudomonas aeruginosa]|nr:hypothetical protein [Pseudomonas aeruginosa]